MRAGTAKAEDLREPQIDLVYAIAPDLTRLDQIDRDGAAGALRRPAENRVEPDEAGARKLGGVPRRAQRCTLIAPDRACDEHIDLRDGVRRQPGDLGDEARVDAAERIGWSNRPVEHRRDLRKHRPDFTDVHDRFT